MLFFAVVTFNVVNAIDSDNEERQTIHYELMELQL